MTQIFSINLYNFHLLLVYAQNPLSWFVLSVCVYWFLMNFVQVCSGDVVHTYFNLLIFSAKYDFFGFLNTTISLIENEDDTVNEIWIEWDENCTHLALNIQRDSEFRCSGAKNKQVIDMYRYAIEQASGWRRLVTFLRMLSYLYGWMLLPIVSYVINT